MINRLSLLCVIVVAFITSLRAADSLILQWSYLSMGLRGAGVFVPLVAAVFSFSLSPGMAFMSGATGITIACLWPILKLPGEGILIGVCVSAMIALFGIYNSKKARIK